MAGDSFQYNIDVNLKTEAAQRQFNKLWGQVQAGSEEAKDAINNILGGTKSEKISIEFDSNLGQYKTKVTQVRSEFDKLDRVIQKKNRTEKGSLTSLRQQLNNARQQRDAISRTVQVINQKGQRVSQLNQKWVTANARVREYAMQVAKANGDMLAFARIKFPAVDRIMKLGQGLNQIVMIGQSVVMAFQAIKGAIDPLIARTKQVEGLQLSMKGFGLTTEQANQVLMASKQIAFEYGASLAQIEKGFKRITPAILMGGGSLKEASDVMAAMSARTTTLGLNTEQAGRYMEAFAQVMGKGKLQSEELNQQFSELDGALRGQVASFVKSKYGIDNLEKAMQNGEITAKIFREAFVAISQEMKDNLKGALDEVQQRLDTMNANQVQNMVNNLNTLTMDSLRETLGGIGKAFQRLWVGSTQFMASIANDLPNVQEHVRDLLTAVGQLADFMGRTLLAALKIVFKTIDFGVGLMHKLRDAIMSIPGIDTVVNSFQKLMDLSGQGFNMFFDQIMGTGDAVQNVTDKMSQLDGRFQILQNRYAEGKIGAEEYGKELDKLRQEMEQETTNQMLKGFQEELDRTQHKVSQLKIALAEAKQEMETKKNAFEEEKRNLQSLKAAIKERYGEEIRLSKEKEQAIKNSITNEKEAYRQVKADIKERYDDEKSRISEIYNAKLELLNMEIDNLNKRTPAEQKLYDMRKKDLQLKANNMNLTKKERLEAQAALERMERQEQIQIKNNEKKEIAKQKQQEEKRLKEEYIQKQKEEKKQHDQKIQKLKQEGQEQKKNTKALEEAQKKYLKQLDEAVSGNKKMFVVLKDIPKLVENQATAARNAADAYNDAKTEVDNISSALDTAITKTKQLKAEMADLKKPSGGGGGNPPNAFSGGPVSGGDKRIVNELGKEAFLSASGRLSMINAPAWGEWKAPSAGTIIPAHLTQQLDIPRNGININKTATVSANRAANGGANMASIAKTIANGMGGTDVITNNVTVQSTNPNKTASDMLVAMTKIRRRRLG